MGELLLLRHAERPDISPNTLGNGVLLTEKGKKDALAFANRLSTPIVNIISSPIERCRQTAEIIAQEARFPQLEISLDTDLGDPGFIIKDGEQAWSHWQEKGHKVVNEYLLSGSEKWAGFYDLNKATRELTEKIRDNLIERPSGLHIWVTHDTILATFAARVLNKPLTLKQWPMYLDYLSVKLNGDDLVYFYSNAGNS